ncbi:protein PF14_0175-like isoform X2 [Aphidius gifuensis]|uniref:protein PF14_0175-like isoform X2 n=1 Tax=Aphidius gifuensis TaxID=684658 RepID=UPI001CDC944A|nr:protein PF14_0175-like isoform X2 [Aphidius gifuensis]
MVDDNTDKLKSVQSQKYYSSDICGTRIPLPRSSNSSLNNISKIDSKITKTEKNRLKLFKKNCVDNNYVDDVNDKEIRITNESSSKYIPRYQLSSSKIYQVDSKEESQLRLEKQHKKHQFNNTFYPDKLDLPATTCLPQYHQQYQQNSINDNTELKTGTNSYQLLSNEKCKFKEINFMEGQTSTSLKSQIKTSDDSKKNYQDDDCSSDEEIKNVKKQHQQSTSSLSSCSNGGTWPIKKDTWMENQNVLYSSKTSTSSGLINHDMASVMSFSSSAGSGCSGSVGNGHRRLGAKVDVVYSLLGMLGSNEGREDMSGTLLAMSNSIDSCLIMRQSGCLPLLIQLIHARGQDIETRERASQALHNVIHARCDEKVGRREVRVLRLLEQIRDYCQMLRISLNTERPLDDLERHPGPTIAALMKLSFDEAHRHAMCQLGGLHAVAELIEMDHAAHGSNSNDPTCITLRRYAGMALTNLTFGDGNNKALLCSFLEFMKSLVLQLQSISDDLRQVTASVLRNLSWRADSGSKKTLREVGAVVGLMKASMEGSKESTLKSILSALWNLSAHCSTNKVDICAVDGALGFLVDMLSYNAPSKTLAIIENAGGILRNVSSHIAVRDDYRKIVRERGCLQVLLSQLRSPSLTVVSNACGALWNLSARCPHDQRLLWDLGAVPMLRSLVHSKHKMISMGSSAALKNLLSARPGGSNLVHLDSTARGLGLPALPTLGARRQKALEQEIDQNLSETCDNIEPSTSPITKDNNNNKFTFNETNFNDITTTNTRLKTSYQRNKFNNNNSNNNGVSRSESRESMKSITSTHSDTIFERVHRHVTGACINPNDIFIKQQSSSLHSAVDFNQTFKTDYQNKTSQIEKNYALKYNNTTNPNDIIRPTELGINILDIGEIRCTSSTMSWAAGPNQQSISPLLRSSIDDKSLTTSSNNINLLDEEQIIDESFDKHLKSPSTSSTATTTFKSIKNTKINSPTLSSHASEIDPFSDYAETDLDQPTNYSLRYAEKNSDEDEKQSSGYFAGSEQDIEDTVKTYYTEGTPYENSLNSSRATSHSDLQDDTKNTKLIDKLNADERGIITRMKELNIYERKTSSSSSSSSKRNSYIDKTENPILNSSLKRLSLPPNPIDINSDIDSGIDGINTNYKKINKNFDDHVVVESTTVRLNSLGNIINNDESKIINDCKLREREIKLSKKQLIGTIEPESLTESLASDADDNEDDEDLLAACIHVGMQNNRHNQSFSRNSLETINNSGHLTRYETSTELNQVEEKTNNPSKLFNMKLNSDDDLTLINNNNTIDLNTTNEDSSVNSIEENDMHPTGECAESMESYDSVERSEQVLLELCIKKMSNDKSSQDIIDGKNDNNNISQEDANNCEEYRRQRDPDAMIACLDRLTATLVQETEAMREKELSTMKQSTMSDKIDTWNEDSPNDNSFPTITMSAPFVGSFKSDENPGTLQSLSSEESPIPARKNNINLNNEMMTTSKIIEQEAFKLAEAVNAEYGEISIPCNDLESIKPPSTMGSAGSLVTSYTAPENCDNNSMINNERCYSTSLPSGLVKNSRKKSLPIGIVAKRALGQTSNTIHSISLENLLNDTSSISQLENVKPPSMMEDLLTLDSVGDMENSMLSVASITSEIADLKYGNTNDCSFDIVKPIANTLSMTCKRYAEGSAGNSLSEYLENINPPSLLNEVSEIDDTTVDANTDTMCSDTLCMDIELLSEELGVTHTIYSHKIDENDNDTDGATTPIPTEYSLSSSAESTPKKRHHKNHLTPKQKRQLAKERYKTYTIAAELVKKEEEERKKLNVNGKLSFTKLTPKQKRQEDRARFQTQVLDNPLKNIITNLAQQETKEEENNNEEEEDKNSSEFDIKKNDTTDKSQSLMKSGIPSFKGLTGTFNKKKTRVENKDRYQTKILNESSNSNDITTSSEEVQTMLEKNSNIVNEKTITTTNTDKYSTYVRKSHQEIENNVYDNEDDDDNSNDVELQKKDKTLTQQDIYENDNDEDEDDVNANSDSEDEIIEVEVIEEQQPKKPKIIKPSGSMSRDPSVDSSNPEPPSPKGIRGRRKALYSTPNTRKSTPQSSPIKKVISSIPIGRSNTTPLVRATRATTLRQNNNTNNNNLATTTTTKDNLLQKTNYIARNVELSKRSSIPQRGTSYSTTPTATTGKQSIKRHSTPPGCQSQDKKKPDVPKPLERQGTFTKDEPEMDNPPIVSANSSPIKISKIGKLQISSPSKLNTIFKSKIKNNNYQTKLSKCASAEGIPSKRLSIGETSKIIYNENDKKPILVKRSNTNLNLNTQSSLLNPSGSKKNQKDPTSKIKSLWKKVEENKFKQKYEKPDKRQWITKEHCNTKSADDDDDNNNNITETKNSTYRLFRSSTFEGVPKQSNLLKNKTKITDKLTEVSIDDDKSISSGVNNDSKIPKFGDTCKGKKKQSGYDTVVLRKQKSIDSTDGDLTKRISRLGSFIRVDPDNPENGLKIINNNTTQNYHQTIDIDTETIVTSSSKVTTV